MDTKILQQTANALVARGKGILAMDESHATCKKRFEGVGLACTEESRRAYRELLITAPGIEAYISGMILFDETIRQNASDGTPFPQVLKHKGILCGIKVDLGAKDLALHPGEKITEGLDGLRERLAEYVKYGAAFTKWRAVITIGAQMPSTACLKANAHALGRYAALSQEANLTPILEPEVLIDGDHSLARCYEVIGAVLKEVFSEARAQGVFLEGSILKTSMVLSGKDHPQQAATEEVAQATVQCLKENVPVEIAGVAFLSGGQDDEKATAHLNAMNRLGELPWPLTFSYARALQNSALKIWAENRTTNTVLAQEALVRRARANALALQGKYVQ